MSEQVTHGRHCECSACAREDWTRITGPCGMHGASCPAVYAPIKAMSDDVLSAALLRVEKRLARIPANQGEK